MRHRKAVHGSDLSAKNYFSKQCWMKYKQRWKVSTPTSSATIPHHNQYNFFNYFQYLHWCTQNTLKKEIFFFSSFLNAFKSSCTFRAFRKQGICVYLKKKKNKNRKKGCSLGASVFVYLSLFVRLLPIRCIPGRDVIDGCGRHGRTAYASSTFRISVNIKDILNHQNKIQKSFFSVPLQLNWFYWSTGRRGARNRK